MKGLGRRTITVIVSICATGAIVLAATVAWAATGDLTYKNCITGETDSGPTGTKACSEIPSATAAAIDDSGLAAARAVAVSPDGNSVYVVAAGDDAVATFDRNPTSGALAYDSCISGATQTGPAGSGACDLIPSAASFGTNSGLGSPAASIAISADGKSLYVVSINDDSVVRFDRDATGALTYAGCISGSTAVGPSGSGACTAIPKASAGGVNSGLDVPGAVAASADGKTVYVIGAADDAVARFSRNTTSGALTYHSCISSETESGPSGSGACKATPTATIGGTNSGLDSPGALTLSADGKSLYVTATVDDSVARFDRVTTTGALTYSSCVSGETQSGPGGSAACSAIPKAASAGANSGLDNPAALAVTADGTSVYVVAQLDDAVARFARAANGALAYKNCVSGETESGSAGSRACSVIASGGGSGLDSGLSSPNSLIVSADGSSVYVTSQADGVAYLERNPTSGALAYDSCISGRTSVGPAGSGACALIPKATVAGTNSGLDDLRGIAISPDGKSIYLASTGDDAVARFNRAP
jgi:DNA-binding beta-propeller fold protein YncE